jgi:hypothetical protein
MNSENLSKSQANPEVCPVGDSVGYLDTEVRNFLACPWCCELLPVSKTRPRLYCSEAHEKAFKRARYVSKEQHKARKLADTNDAWTRFSFNPRLGAFFDSRSKVKQPELIKYRHSYMGGVGLHTPMGSLRTAPCKVRHQVNDLDRPTVPEPTPLRATRRYTAPSNAYPVEEKLTRAIFSRRGDLL